MSSICIPKEIFNKEGFEDIFKIQDSLLREKKLGEFLDAKTARNINNRFEHTKLLKQADIGYNKMIDDLQGLNDVKKMAFREKMKLELIRKEELLENLQEVGEVKSGDILDFEKMADDIYKKKHNLSISEEQGSNIIKLTNDLSEASKLPKLENGNYQDAYGQALSNLNRYIDNVKDPSRSMTLGKQIKYDVDIFKTELSNIEGPYQKFAHSASKGAGLIFSSTWKTMKATLDASFLGIQGIAFGTRNPTKFVESVKMAFKAFGNKDMMEVFRIKIFSDKDYKKAILSGSRLLTPEEQFASNSLEKIPWLGRAIKATNDAFTIFLAFFCVVH